MNTDFQDRYGRLLAAHDLTRSHPAASPWEGLVLANGDMGAVIFGPAETLCFRLTKLDLWDSRWPEDLADFPLYPLSEFKALAAAADAAPGERLAIFDTLPFAGATVPYPCLRMGADLVLGIGALHNRVRPSQRLRLTDATWEGSWNLRFWSTQPMKVESFVCRDRNVMAMRLDLDRALWRRLRLTLLRSAWGGRDREQLAGGEWGLRGWTDPASGALPPPHLEVVNGIALLTLSLPAGRYSDGATYCVAAASDHPAHDWTVAGDRLVFAGQGLDRPAHVFVASATSRDSADPRARALELARTAREQGWEHLHGIHRRAWQDFWRANRVELADKGVERTWHRLQYQLFANVRPDGPPPGLFGAAIPYDAPPWRGDRHNNWPEYAGIFWGALQSNHPELLDNYVRHIRAFLPEAKRLAREIFEADGLVFPHLYLDYSQRPYFDNLWSRSLYLTAITAQPFWWRYQYTQDREFLAEEAYEVLAGSSDFYCSLVAKNDPGDFSLWPTVPPEYRGFVKDFTLNRDCVIDLALVRFLLRASIGASIILDRDPERRAAWQRLLEGLADYPTLDSGRGLIFGDVVGNDRLPEWNHPIAVTPMFPGEDPECFGDGRWRQVAEQTLAFTNWRDFAPPAHARLGQVETAFARAGGRRRRELPPGEDANVNYANDSKRLLYVAELLLSSWDGVIRIFPAWPRDLDAEFTNLRTVGAFLVSAELRDGEIVRADIVSEVGGRCRVLPPWPETRVVDVADGRAVAVETAAGELSFQTLPGGHYRLQTAP